MTIAPPEQDRSNSIRRVCSTPASIFGWERWKQTPSEGPAGNDRWATQSETRQKASLAMPPQSPQFSYVLRITLRPLVRQLCGRSRRDRRLRSERPQAFFHPPPKFFRLFLAD